MNLKVFLIPMNSFQVLWDMIEQMLGMEILTSKDVCKKQGGKRIKHHSKITHQYNNHFQMGKITQKRLTNIVILASQCFARRPGIAWLITRCLQKCKHHHVKTSTF